MSGGSPIIRCFSCCCPSGEEDEPTESLTDIQVGQSDETLQTVQPQPQQPLPALVHQSESGSEEELAPLVELGPVVMQITGQTPPASRSPSPVPAPVVEGFGAVMIINPEVVVPEPQPQEQAMPILRAIVHRLPIPDDVADLVVEVQAGSQVDEVSLTNILLFLRTLGQRINGLDTDQHRDMGIIQQKARRIRDSDSEQEKQSLRAEIREIEAAGELRAAEARALVLQENCVRLFIAKVYAEAQLTPQEQASLQPPKPIVTPILPGIPVIIPSGVADLVQGLRAGDQIDADGVTLVMQALQGFRQQLSEFDREVQRDDTLLQQILTQHQESTDQGVRSALADQIATIRQRKKYRTEQTELISMSEKILSTFMTRVREASSTLIPPAPVLPLLPAAPLPSQTSSALVIPAGIAALVNGLTEGEQIDEQGITAILRVLQLYKDQIDDLDVGEQEDSILSQQMIMLLSEHFDEGAKTALQAQMGNLQARSTQRAAQAEQILSNERHLSAFVEQVRQVSPSLIVALPAAPVFPATLEAAILTDVQITASLTQFVPAWVVGQTLGMQDLQTLILVRNDLRQEVSSSIKTMQKLQTRKGNEEVRLLNLRHSMRLHAEGSAEKLAALNQEGELTQQIADISARMLRLSEHIRNRNTALQEVEEVLQALVQALTLKVIA